MLTFSFSFPADLFGILGIITTILIYQMRTSKYQLVWKMITDALWIVYYALQGNYSVVVITLVAILRSLVLISQKKWARGIWWMYIFMAISIASSLLVWKDWTSLLTMISSLLCIVMYWYRNPRMVRFITVPATILFMVNVILNQNWMGLISESFLLASAIIGIIRLDIMDQTKKQKE